MKKSVIYSIWAALYCLCVGLGFVENPEGFGKALLVATSLIFFLPPFYLAYRAKKENDRKTLTVLRLVSGSVLTLSLALLVLNFLSVYFDARTGLALYVMLVMFSAPMVCGQFWVLSLFLWACLLMTSIFREKHP